MIEAVERPPALHRLLAQGDPLAGVPLRGLRGIGGVRRIGQKGDLRAGRSERDRLLLKIDLGTLIVGIWKRTDEQKPHPL